MARAFTASVKWKARDGSGEGNGLNAPWKRGNPGNRRMLQGNVNLAGGCIRLVSHAPRA